MPILSHAQNIGIHGGEFTDIGVQQNICGPSGLDFLRETSIPEAALDSEARHPAPSCFPGTREQHVEDIISWAVSSMEEQPLSVYWMKGPAGVGKTALAQTCAERLHGMGHLGAAFFFSINGRDDHTRLFTTLAYQLAVELPNFREIVEKNIDQDKTLVTKTLASQFEYLIARPFRELNRSGEALERRTIFIDGLDECRSADAQCEIIDIIANFAQERSSPSRWAFFSRPEPHIEASFAKLTVAPICNINLLPISRDADAEIEIYLRGGFRNMLQRRNLSPSCPWPSDNEIRELVKAASGLFIYAAAVLRFIHHYPSLAPDEPLRVVLAAIAFPRHTKDAHSLPSPFVELDTLYKLIMQQIPERALPSVQLLLAHIRQGDFIKTWSAIYLANMLRLSQSEFQGICNYLPAVIQFLPGRPEIAALPEVTENSTELINQWASGQLLDCGGSLMFYHKSFYDFLGEPTRSGAFCVSTPSVYTALFERFLQLHFNCTKSYVIQDAKLVLPPDVPSYATRLSWSLASELINSHLHKILLGSLTVSLLYDFETDMDDLNSHSLQALSGLDYRKSLLGMRHLFASGSARSVTRVLSCPAISTVVRGTFYTCITPEWMRDFDASAFQRMIRRSEKKGLIKRYSPPFSSKLKSLFSMRSETTRSGLYKLGRGEKTILWYWEFDLEKGYYHEFRTLDIFDAQRTYSTEKFNLWEE